MQNPRLIHIACITQSLLVVLFIEIVKIAGQRWSNVDSRLKEKLTQEYTEESDSYKKRILDYEHNLTSDQKESIKQAKLYQSELKDEKYYRKVCALLLSFVEIS